MPVPTETLRSTRKLNIIFAASAIALLGSTLWLVFADYERQWRHYQRDAQTWQALVTADTLEQRYPAQMRRQLSDLSDRANYLRSTLPHAEIERKESELALIARDRQKADLPMAIAKSLIVPTGQKLERAILEHSDDPDHTDVLELRKELTGYISVYEAKKEIAQGLDAQIKTLTDELIALRKQHKDQLKELENLEREKKTLEENLENLAPTGLNYVGKKLRNSPLLDAFNPSEKIVTINTPHNRFDVKFLTTDSTDSCVTCHFNIDKPEFQLDNIVQFISRQLASASNHPVNQIETAVVDLDYWTAAANKLASTNPAFATKLKHLQFGALTRINQAYIDAIKAADTQWRNDAKVKGADKDAIAAKRAKTGPALKAAQGALSPLTDAKTNQWLPADWANLTNNLEKKLASLATTKGDLFISAADSYAQRDYYRTDLQQLIETEIGGRELYRLKRMQFTQMVATLNTVASKRAENQNTSWSDVSANPVMLAHPKLDKYLDPESAHPKLTMGCTICHEGSGEDTDFNHAAHVPQDMWVDRETGAPIASFLIQQQTGSVSQLKQNLRKQQEQAEKAKKVASSNQKSSTANTLFTRQNLLSYTSQSASAAAPKSDHKSDDKGGKKTDHDHSHATASHQDVNILHETNPAPFAPKPEVHDEATTYLDPSNTSTPRIAITQSDYWKSKYHWHHIHFMEWEKPMHAMEHIESSCSKCHTEHYDIWEEAPTFTEGRKLFTQVGCGNCHAAEAIANHLDLKKVGPSLAYIKHKLSPEMTASWIWSPKAFRPMANMPHFFMLENNSSPADILRTRVEVAAITYYLHNAPPGILEELANMQKQLIEYDKIGKDKTKSISQQIAASNKYQAMLPKFEALKKQAKDYNPELSPTQAQLKTLATEADSIKEKAKAKDITAEDKAAGEKRLAAIAGEVKALKAKPMTGDAARGRELFFGSKKDDRVKAGWAAGIGCAACHTNMNETGKEWITTDIASRSPLNGQLWFYKDLLAANGNMTADQASAVVAKLIADVPENTSGLTPEAGIKAIGSVAKSLTEELIAAAKELGKMDEKTTKAAREAQALEAAAKLLASWQSKVADAAYNALTYNQQHTYVMQFLPDLLNRRGPELSGIGTKLLAGQSKARAQRWLYDWLRNPKHYSETTIMPSFRLSPQEALDLSAYLLSQQRPAAASEDDNDKWQAQDFLSILLPIETQKAKEGDEAPADPAANLSPEQKQERSLYAAMLNAIATKQGLATGAKTDATLYQLGKKMLTHYNCQSCHMISGLENVPSAAPQLDEWGLKDPHKLDYGYFEHAEASRRELPASVWKAVNEGLAADAKSIDHNSTTQLQSRELEWEHIEGERRPWMYHKVHNPRIYDRGRYALPNEISALADNVLSNKENLTNALRQSVDKAYDKLKMPKFFLRDDQAKAIITFVTSLRTPYVSEKIKVSDPATIRMATGRQIATRYNCYGCHNIEGNDVSIHREFDIADAQGHFNYDYEKSVNAPPRLIGQGAKTKPEWTKWFLTNVHPIRSALKVRMPSFPIPEHHAGEVSNYFAGASEILSRNLAKNLEAINGEKGVINTTATSRRNLVEQREITREVLAAHYAEIEKPKEDQDLAKLLKETHIRAMNRKLEVLDSQIAQASNWVNNPTIALQKHNLKQAAIELELVNPKQLDPRTSTAASRSLIWRGDGLNPTAPSLVKRLDFIASMNNIVFPYPAIELPDMSDERFARGENMFFNQMNCNKCHPMGNEDTLMAIWKKENPTGAGAKPAGGEGDDDPYGDDEPAGKTSAKASDKSADTTTAKTAAKPAAADSDDPYGEDDDDPYGDGKASGKTAEAKPTGPAWTAPNLKYAVHRLQPRWMQYWIAHPPTALNGTKMPPLWGQALNNWDASFVDDPNIPVEARTPFHEKFGWTGEAQRQLIIDYVNASGMRNYTPRTWVLEDKKGPDYAALPAIKEPQVAFKIPDLPDMSATAGGSTTGGPKTAKGPIKEKTTSDIKLNADNADLAAYEGDGAHGNKTRVVGVIEFGGAPPSRSIIIMGSDANCVKANKTKPRNRKLVVNDQKQVQFAFVRVKSAVASTYDPPSEPVLLDQVGCVYMPHVVGVMVGQPLQTRNSDSILHNVHGISKSNGEWNVGQPVKGMIDTRSFTAAESGIAVKCDVHAWMGAVIHVTENPFFATSDVEGRFEILGLPPGDYTLEVIHEDKSIAPVEFKVTVKAGQSTQTKAVIKK